MGNFHTKTDDVHPSTPSDSNAAPAARTDDRQQDKEVMEWEEIYKERFTRPFKFSKSTWEPLPPVYEEIEVTALAYPPTKLMDADPYWNHRNPRYAEIVERTRYELKLTYHSINQFMLRCRQKCIWMPSRGSSTVHVPYLDSNSDGVSKFPPASNIKNGHILPARIRARILGENDEIPPHKDPFLTQQLEYCYAAPGTHDLSGDARPQVQYEDNFLQEGSWLNQTTAVYFEPEFMEEDPWGIESVARALMYAWREVHEANQETPTLQQKRYFANPVVLLPGGEGAKRNRIADVAATHRRICDALADAQDKPIGPRDPYSWVEHGVEMGVVYPSIIIVVRDETNAWKAKTEAECRDILFQQYSVLLVRTGREEHLSAPIDFSELPTLPFDQDEVSSTHVVRVRIRDAVRFIMNLERRERECSPRLQAMKNILDAETLREAEAYATEALMVAEDNGGIDRNKATWEEFHKAQAYFENDPISREQKLASGMVDDTDVGQVRRWALW